MIDFIKTSRQLGVGAGLRSLFPKGSLLGGDSQENNQIKKDGFIGKSGNAYKRIYPAIAKAIKNEDVTIKYTDLD